MTLDLSQNDAVCGASKTDRNRKKPDFDPWNTWQPVARSEQKFKHSQFFENSAGFVSQGLRARILEAAPPLQPGIVRLYDPRSPTHHPIDQIMKLKDILIQSYVSTRYISSLILLLPHHFKWLIVTVAPTPHSVVMHSLKFPHNSSKPGVGITRTIFLKTLVITAYKQWVKWS